MKSCILKINKGEILRRIRLIMNSKLTLFNFLWLVYCRPTFHLEKRANVTEQWNNAKQASLNAGSRIGLSMRNMQMSSMGFHSEIIPEILEKASREPINSLVTDLLMRFKGVLIACGIGVLLFLLTGITGSLFCCCRMCGRCGGRNPKIGGYTKGQKMCVYIGMLIMAFFAL